MNLMRWLGNLVSPSPEQRAASDAEMYTLLSGGGTYAGPPVSEESAMRYGAIYACVRIISESIAALPLPLMRSAGRAKEHAIDHPLYSVLHDMANPEMTAFEWRELTFSHVLTWGNGYSEKEFDPLGRIIALWPLRPDKMEEIRRNPQGGLEYVYRLPDGTLRSLPGFRIHHVRGPGDALVGYSPIRVAARQATGLGLATEEYGARFFSNGARPGVLLKHPGKLSPGAYDRLKASFADEHQGLSNAHRTKILEEGMDVATVGIPPNEAQFLETRKFQVTEIARIYRVPPHLLADLERATFTNIEQQGLNFVQYTLLPWLVRHEQRIGLELLTPTERTTLYAKYIVAGLLRGDMASRNQAYATGINTGYLTRNEARELEDLNPLPGLDAPLMPLNMIEVGAAPAPTAPSTPAPAAGRAAVLPTPDREERAARTPQSRQAIMNRHVPLFSDSADRATKREIADIRKVLPRYFSKRGKAEFEKWLATFYEQMRDWLPDYFRALMNTYSQTIMAAVAAEVKGEPAPLDAKLRTWIEEYLKNFASVHTVGGEKQLRTLLEDAESDDEAEQAITTRLDDWEETRAPKTALEQAFEAGNALAIYGYAAAGVRELVWTTVGESCPLCQDMDGRKVGIEGSFFQAGDTHTAEGVDPLPIVRDVKHGPLHSGCDCIVMAA